MVGFGCSDVKMAGNRVLYKNYREHALSVVSHDHLTVVSFV